MFDVTQKHQAEEELRRLERATAPGAAAGGDGHARGRHRARLQQHPGRDPRLRRDGARDAPKGSRLRRDLDSIMTAGERGRALVDRILAFSRSGVGERVAVHVERVVREALDLLAAKLPRASPSRRDCARAAPRCWATRRKCTRWLMNLADQRHPGDALGRHAARVARSECGSMRRARDHGHGRGRRLHRP